MEKEWPRLNGFIAGAEGWNSAESASNIMLSEIRLKRLKFARKEIDKSSKSF